MLYKLQKSEITIASEVLADAFTDDPLWGKIFEGVLNGYKKYPLVSRLFIKYYLRYGEVWASSENLEGIMALSMGNQSFITTPRMILSGAIVPFMQIGIKAASRVSIAFDPMEKDRKKYMSGKPYIYLAIIGVSTNNQGKGYGGKLIHALIEKSEQENVPLYLETETEDNVRLYEKYGFETVKKTNLLVVDLPMWEMKREPKNEVI